MTTINGKPTKLRGVAVDTVECGDGCLRFAKKSSIRKQSKKRGQVGEERHVQNLSGARSSSLVSASVIDPAAFSDDRLASYSPDAENVRGWQSNKTGIDGSNRSSPPRKRDKCTMKDTQTHDGQALLIEEPWEHAIESFSRTYDVLFDDIGVEPVSFVSSMGLTLENATTVAQSIMAGCGRSQWRPRWELLKTHLQIIEPEVVLAAMAVCDRDFESALSLAAEVHEMDEARAHETESESRRCPEESTYDEEPPAQHFVPAVMGRVVDGNGRISRLSYANTRPYEHCFVDVKAISKKMPQQGSQQLLFVLVDFYSFRIHVRSMKLKSESAAALSDIITETGMHKYPWSCTVHYDGDGTAATLKDTCKKFQLSWLPTPPHLQSLNMAELAIRVIYKAGRQLLYDSRLPLKYLHEACKCASYNHQYIPTTQSRDWRTPWEMVFKEKPDIAHLKPFGADCYVHQLDADGNQRYKVTDDEYSKITTCVPAVFVGWQDMRTKVPKVLLHNGSYHTVAHTRDIVFGKCEKRQPTAVFPVVEDPFLDHEFWTAELTSVNCDDTAKVSRVPVQEGQSAQGTVQNDPAISTVIGEQSNVQQQHDVCATHSAPLSQSPATKQPVACNPRQDPIGTIQPRQTRSIKLKQQPVSTRTRRQNVALLAGEQNDVHKDSIFKSGEDVPEWFKTEPQPTLSHTSKAAIDMKLQSVNRYHEYGDLSYALAAEQIAAMKDANWRKFPDQHKARAAWDEELTALTRIPTGMKTGVLEILQPDHPEYGDAQRKSTLCRAILDVKRNGRVKCRIVKRGDLEKVDDIYGEDFNFYAHVAKQTSVRMALSDLRQHQQLAIVDVATAFLQSHRFPADEPARYVKIKVPFVSPHSPPEWIYARQHGPVYGERGAPILWEQTIAPWLESQGFVRGMNDRCIFLRADGMKIILYVDDCMMVGTPEQVSDFHKQITTRFACREIEVLSETNSVDYLGMVLSIADGFLDVSMKDYTYKMLERFPECGTKQETTPISGDIIADETPLAQSMRRRFMAGCGCIGWLSTVMRLDLTYAHSRVSQMLAAPTVGAYKVLMQIMRYARSTADIRIRCKILEEYEQPAWSFYTDSDYASNALPNNKRRSQSGCVVMRNGFPILWHSKVSSVCFAHADLQDAHADISVAAAEVYAAGNGVNEILHISYCAEEMGLKFPKPFTLLVDNKACKIFCDNTAYNTKLKHIDCRLEWVRTLRDRTILKAQWVASADNLSDLFTKIQPEHVFKSLRDRMMML